MSPGKPFNKENSQRTFTVEQFKEQQMAKQHLSSSKQHQQSKGHQNPFAYRPPNSVFMATEINAMKKVPISLEEISKLEDQIFSINKKIELIENDNKVQEQELELKRKSAQIEQTSEINAQSLTEDLQKKMALVSIDAAPINDNDANLSWLLQSVDYGRHCERKALNESNTSSIS